MNNDKNLIFKNEISVRIDDINYGNHLCHTRFVNLIHNSRALFLKKHNLSELNCFGSALIMLNLEIYYKSQCFFDDTLEISIYFDSIEKATFKFLYSVLNKTTGKIAASLKTTMGFFSIQNQSLMKPPAEFKHLIDSLVLVG